MVPTLLASGSAAEGDIGAYLPAAIALALGGFIAALLIGLVTAIGTVKEKSHYKRMPYEAGSIPVGSARRRVNVQFYIVALLFIAFDLETIFLFIWAPVARELGVYGLLAMGVFLLLLILGLVYEWKKGALQWSPRTAPEGDEA
ncbi:MAG: NADH-quinone oxidoreductase subunit A [Deltaproteobacteria bacterium]|nr:NADH-quinone oxidoreductase subunit A [Deltaproteobacteria bacterium]